MCLLGQRVVQIATRLGAALQSLTNAAVLYHEDYGEEQSTLNLSIL